MYFVYLLECTDTSIYTGITTNLARRLTEHRAGLGGHYTKAHGALKILYFEMHPNRSSASKREAAIKKLTRAKKLELVRAKRQKTAP